MKVFKELSVAAAVRKINRELESVVKMSQDEVTETLLIQAGLVAREIKSLAPIDPTSDTPGALRASIRVEEGKPKGKKSAVVKVKAGDQTTLKATNSGKAYQYPRAVEFGTQNMEPKPFFYPVWRARRKGVRSVVRKAIKNAVKRTFK